MWLPTPFSMRENNWAVLQLWKEKKQVKQVKQVASISRKEVIRSLDLSRMKSDSYCSSKNDISLRNKQQAIYRPGPVGPPRRPHWSLVIVNGVKESITTWNNWSLDDLEAEELAIEKNQFKTWKSPSGFFQINRLKIFILVELSASTLGKTSMATVTLKIL